MIDDGTMIAYLNRDVRGRLRGDPDNLELRRMAWLMVESTGNPCPPQAMDAAVDRWLELGAPEPTPGVRVCLFCGEQLSEMSCLDCDITYGESWATDPAKQQSLNSGSEIPDMDGNLPRWGQRPPRWDLKQVFDAH